MIIFGLWYLSVAAAIYLICFIGDGLTGFKLFFEASWMDCVCGVLGALIWPYMILLWAGKLDSRQECGGKDDVD